MADLQDQIELLQIEIQKANAAIAKAVRERRAVNKDSPLIVDLNSAVEAAKQALIAVEVKLRALYESKSDD
jgi:predicted  nucleic acid-binding Zn-ribbon protein